MALTQVSVLTLLKVRRHGRRDAGTPGRCDGIPGRLTRANNETLAYISAINMTTRLFTIQILRFVVRQHLCSGITTVRQWHAKCQLARLMVAL